MRIVKSGLLGLALLALAGPALAEDKLIIGNEGTYPPFSMVTADGQLTGVEPDLTREMCTRMKVTCEFAVMDFKALIPSLLQNKVDVVASQVTPTPERKEKALFSVPVVYNPDIFVTRKDKTYEFTVAGLKGVRIGVQRGSAMATYITAQFGDAPVISLYDNPDQIRLDLLAGRIDMTYGAKLNWTAELIDKPEGKDYTLAGGDHWSGDMSIPEDQRGSSWIVRKGEDALLARMDEAIKSMIADCTFTQIRKKYLSAPIVAGEAACVKAG
ncbi:ABC transporter substrate-binding protein [Oleomonas cavernae]|uniref:ABC transporter substrate-binding protein n=1 Tax=Oleomonas cavernae TaxID=2320859 RepID=A0A418WGW1_9PROT|nr:transporter substrate-binding domain-containing protein [Oleomonas cavernae]RJF89255.1 ABC transporter substrate-binding protein [Oleomonas cavernae]